MTGLYETAAELSATAADLADAIDSDADGAASCLATRASDLLDTIALALGAAPAPPGRWHCCDGTCASRPPRTVYLAARYSRRAELLGYRADLARAGITVTSRWLNGNHQIDNHGIPVTDDGQRAAIGDPAAGRLRTRFAAEDVADVLAADMLIAFTEQPRASTTRGGRHVELGLALGAGKRVAVIGPRENLFCWLPHVEHHPAWPGFLATLTAITHAPPDWWSTEDVAAYLQVAPSTVRAYVARQQMPQPARSIGHARVWHPQAIRDWHQSRPRRPGASAGAGAR